MRVPVESQLIVEKWRVVSMMSERVCMKDSELECEVEFEAFIVVSVVVSG